MTKRLMTILAAICLATGAAAQEAWLQIAARPGAAETVATARDYARRLDSVSAFALEGSRFGAIVLGPYPEAEIDARRRTLRSQGLIPADSYATDGARFGDRLFPEMGGEATAPAAEPETGAEAAGETGAEAAPTDQTPAEARRAERRLTGAERRDLQRALRWAGHYDGPIDGAIGPGTRAAMSAWQRAAGDPATGVMTTAQRRELRAAYEAVLDGLEMRPVTDARAGITVEMPTALVAFDRHAPPFAHYPARQGAEIPARVILISMEGGRAELRGLYDVMQSLEIVPEAGERSRSADAFAITGRGAEIVSRTEVRLSQGRIKGFTLVWPAGDERRRARVVAQMRDSFATDPGRVLPEAMGPPDDPQGADLLAGLEIRRPDVTRSGFYVSPQGAVLTTAGAVESCDRITLDHDIAARVTTRDPATGLALVTPEADLAPRAHAELAAGVPRLGAEAILAGFSYGGRLGAPSLTRGRLAAIWGLDGAGHLRRYELPGRESDAGGPLLAPSGAVLGMAAEPPGGARSLPAETTLAVGAAAINDLLAGAGLPATSEPAGEPLPAARLERLARDMTVLVQCWR